MLKVVSNTTPIISLLKLSRLDLLKEIYGKIIVPNAVYDEIEHGKQKNYYQNLKRVDWIEIKKINDEWALKYFMDLDAGEAETIVLATEIQADLVLIDEQLGRYHAKYANLKVTGTIGILLKAKSMGLMDKVMPLLNELTTKGVWLSDNLLNKIAEIAHENKV